MLFMSVHYSLHKKTLTKCTVLQYIILQLKHYNFDSNMFRPSSVHLQEEHINYMCKT